MSGFAQRVLARVIACSSPCWLFAAPQSVGKSPAVIRRVAVLGGNNQVEVEVVASQPVTPVAQVLSSPQRLVIDFPNAVPGDALRSLSARRGELLGVRVGLFAQKPPVTRVVLDLRTAQPYQLFPSGNTVIVKLGAADPSASGLSPALGVSSNTRLLPPVQPARKVEVEFQNGKLSIWAEHASLEEVLSEVRRLTGADIPIPAGAQQEQVVTHIGPAPIREALAALLNGSPFNFIIVGSANDPSQLRSLVLTPKQGGVSEGIVYSSSSPAPMAQAAAQPEPPAPAPVQPDPAEPPSEQQPPPEAPQPPQ